MKKLAVVASALAITAVAAQANAAESASATISLLSQTAGPTYNYQVTLTDTGTTNIGTFWFGWVPGEDFLDTRPTSVTNPTSWTDNLTNAGGSDGTAIQWLAGSGAALTPGNSLSTFGFSTADSPAMIAGNSNFYPGTPVGTSFVYSGAPFSDGGSEFVAGVAPVPEPATLCAAGLSVMLLGMRRPRRA